MKIERQKNIYFIDLNQNLFRGYIETYINNKEDIFFRYKFSALEITDIAVFQNGQLITDALFTIEYLKDKIDDRKHFQAVNCNYLNIKLLEIYKNKDLKIKIDFKSKEENSAICFYKPLTDKDNHKEMVCNNKNNDSSGIFPSVDSDQKYKWELIYVYSSLEELKIISPGILRSFVEEDNLLISSYSIENSCANFINFAIGTFSRHEIFNGDDKKLIFCPLYMKQLNESILEIIDDFSNIIKYVEFLLQMSYPLESLSVLFTLIETDMIHSLNVAIYNISHISTFNDIEPKFLIKRLISNIISSQIFDYHVYSRDNTDYWIFCGLKGYLEDYCVRILLGNNEFLFQYKIDKDFVLKNDIYELPLCDEKRDQISYKTDFFIKKSKLVFHTLENNLSKAFLEKIIRFLIEKKDEVLVNFTPDFLSLIKDITGKDMKDFFEFYVFKPGLLKVNFRYSIDTKKNRVDFKIEQRPTSKIFNHNTKAIGNISIASYEVEGCFDHVINMQNSDHFYYHVRTKKRKKIEEEEDEIMPLLWMRMDPKREHLIDGFIEQPDYMFIEQVLDKNVIGQLEALDQLSKNISIQICEVLERVLDSSHVFYKIRIKVMYILSKINIDNFIGFQRLIQFFTKKYFVQSSTIVKPNEFLFVNYFLQKHCVKALSYTNPSIIKGYNGRNVASFSVICSFIINILKFNDNSANLYNDSWYIASVIECLSKPILALQHFEDLENYNSKDTFSEHLSSNVIEDSNTNDYIVNNKGTDFQYDLQENSSDDLKEIFKEDAIDNFTFNEENVKKDKNSFKFIQEALEEVERYRIMDMIFSSHKNIITESIIYLLGRLSIYGCITLTKLALINYSKYPNSFKVRKASFVMLTFLYNDDMECLKYLFDVIKSDIIDIKLLILNSWINLLSIKNEETKKTLFPFQSEFHYLLELYAYDYDFKYKVFEILDFLNNKNVSINEYNKKLITLCETKFNKKFIIRKLEQEKIITTQNLLKIKLKDFKKIKRQFLLDTYLLKLAKPKKRDLEKEEIIEERTKKENTAAIQNEIIFLGTSKKDDVKVYNKSELIVEQKNSRLEDVNLEEMLRFDELNNELDEIYLEFNKVPNEQVQSINYSSNEMSSINFSKNTEHFNRIVNFENDYFNDKSLKQTNLTINKLFNDFRNQVSENSRRTDSSTFSGTFNYLETEFDDNFDSTSRKNNTKETSMDSFPQISSQKVDLEKFLLSDNSEDEEKQDSCKTQILEERDFDRDFVDIGFIPIRNNITQFSSSFESLLSSSNKYSNFSPLQKNAFLKNEESNTIPLKDFAQPRDIFENSKFATSFFVSESCAADKLSKSTLEDSLDNSTSQIKSSNENRKEYFLNSDTDFMRIKKKNLEPLEAFVYRIDELTLRFPIRTKIRLPAYRNFIKFEKDTVFRKRRNKFEELSSPEFYSSKKTSYQIKHNDPITKKLFYGTINNISVKQVNKVIFKNKNNSFFDWRPKTFKEIETYVSSEHRYKKIWREMERALVFALSYSQYGSRTFNIAKRLFDIFEVKIYETYQIPKIVHPMSSILQNYCVDFLNNLCLNDKFFSFIRPVNIDGLDAYVDIVRSPMCLDIVQKKMMKYLTIESFYGDIKQIYKNCVYFNQNKAEIVHSAKKLLKKTQDFDQFLENYKNKISSDEFIKLLLQRFEDSINFIDILRKYDNRQIVTFKELIDEVRNIKSNSMRKFISQQELQREMEIFEDQIYHAFSVYGEKVYSWDIYN